jgi:hypothetical protein
MATQIFEKYLTEVPNPQQATANASNWLREQAKRVTSPIDARRVLSNTKTSDRLVTSLTVGRMYLFMYDPKLKQELPYYDKFPLVFPFRRVKGGFYGINMHYLPPLMRAKLMDALYTIVNNQAQDDTTKLRISYQILSRASRFRYFQPCVKHYLNNHVRTRFLWVPADQWETALFLPLERFVGATKQQVWRDSKRMVPR